MSASEVPPRKFRVLYVGPLAPLSKSTHKVAAMKRLGHEVQGLDTTPYMDRGGPIIHRIRTRTLLGKEVRRLNQDLLVMAANYRPDVIWFDKALFVWRETVAKLRAMGIFTAHQNDDNPFGDRIEAGFWRLILAALPEYDLHLLTRESSLADYRKAGARDVYLFYPAYEPVLHFPPPAGWSDADRTIDVSFVGYPHDDRPQFLYQLWKRYGILTQIWGWGERKWKRTLPKEAIPVLLQGGTLSYDQYRETVWRSRINLGLVSHSNRDEYTGRSFDIPACGGFLLAEDTPGHRALFHDGEEAVFFRSIEDCAEQIKKYLADESARSRIAEAGRRRVETSGYSNEERIDQVFIYIRKKLYQGR